MKWVSIVRQHQLSYDLNCAGRGVLRDFRLPGLLRNFLNQSYHGLTAWKSANMAQSEWSDIILTREHHVASRDD